MYCIHIHTEHGNTFLCKLHHSHVIVTVLSHCVPQNGMTALIWASHRGETEVVQELLSSGAKVDLQNEVRHNIN